MMVGLTKACSNQYALIKQSTHKANNILTQIVLVQAHSSLVIHLNITLIGSTEIMSSIDRLDLP